MAAIHPGTSFAIIVEIYDSPSVAIPTAQTVIIGMKIRSAIAKLPKWAGNVANSASADSASANSASANSASANSCGLPGYHMNIK